MTDVLAAGSTIGILGGGQLGRMLAVAAARLGYRAHIYDPSPEPPAADVAHRVTTAGWDDNGALHEFAMGVHVVTYEFENIPVSTVGVLEKHRPVRPGRMALATAQDRYLEKSFFTHCGLPCTAHADVPTFAAFEAAVARLGLPVILKTRRMGYDGKGQKRISEGDDLRAAYDSFGRTPLIVEAVVPFTREISAIAARGLGGEVRVYDPGENVHRDGILRTTTVPADITPRERSWAMMAAAKVMQELEYVGVMGVEFFQTQDGLYLSEFAPRVHNSGHWTQNGCAVDQFEQHIRAIAGLPLGNGKRYANVVMSNLIGDDVLQVPEILAEPGAALHLYGKAEVRADRKMGHVNRVRPLSDQA